MYKTTSKVVEQILNNYDSLTKLEKEIAEFFIENDKVMDFSSKNIAKHRYVSEASLSRFAQKCGFKGYRDFVYQYERYIETKKQDANFDTLTKRVLNVYQELLSMSINLVDENQMDRIVDYVSDSDMLMMFGMGSSGVLTEEIKLRLARIGLHIETAQDAHRIRIYTSLLGDKDVAIGISLSGRTIEVLEGLKLARENGAKTVLITSNTSEHLKAICDEVIMVASINKLEYGTVISPQYPILFVLDILFAYYLHRDMKEKEALYSNTLTALNKKEAP